MQDDVRFMRIRTRRHEIMISPGACCVHGLTEVSDGASTDERYLLAVLHDPTAT